MASLPLYTHDLGENSTQPLLPHRNGAMMMGLASFMISFMHAGTKILDKDGIPISQMILIRCVTLTIVVWLIIRVHKIPNGFLGPMEVRQLLLARSVLSYLGLASFMASVTHLRLGDAVTLSFVIPIMMIIVAVTFMNEPLSKYDVISVLLGISGVICVAQPEVLFGHSLQALANTKTIGYIYAAISTLANTFGNLLIRSIGNRAHTLHIVAYVMIVPIIPSFLWCYFIDYHLIAWPSSIYYYVWLCTMIFGAFFGQILFSHSLQITTVNVVTPLIFLQVVFAFINDWLLFHLTPPAMSLLGAILVAFAVLISNLS